MNYRSRGYRLNRTDRTILSMIVRCLFIGRGKHQHNIVHHYFHCFRLGLLHDLSPRNEEKQHGHQIHPFSFLSSPLLTIVEHLFRQTNNLVAKGFYKSLKGKSPFRL